MKNEGVNFNKFIIKYCLRIIFVLFFAFLSYEIFSSNTLSSYAQIAANDGKENLDLEIIYKEKDETYKNEGTLFIKNPNTYVVNSNVYLKINKSSLDNLSLLEIEINDKIISKDKFVDKDDLYIISIDNNTIGALDTITYEIKFNKSDSYNKFLMYNFEIKQSFYY